MRVECEGSTAAWLAGTLVAPSVQGHGLPPLQELWPYESHLMRRVDSLERTDAGRDWGQEEKGTTEDEMAGWHHRLNEHKFERTQGVGDGQGGLACCKSLDCKESDTTE